MKRFSIGRSFGRGVALILLGVLPVVNGCNADKEEAAPSQGGAVKQSDTVSPPTGSFATPPGRRVGAGAKEDAPRQR